MTKIGSRPVAPVSWASSPGRRTAASFGELAENANARRRSFGSGRPVTTPTGRKRTRAPGPGAAGRAGLRRLAAQRGKARVPLAIFYKVSSPCALTPSLPVLPWPLSRPAPCGWRSRGSEYECCANRVELRLLSRSSSWYRQLPAWHFHLERHPQLNASRNRTPDAHPSLPPHSSRTPRRPTCPSQGPPASVDGNIFPVLRPRALVLLPDFSFSFTPLPDYRETHSARILARGAVIFCPNLRTGFLTGLPSSTLVTEHLF